jgi:hypothetical protein
MCGDVAGGGCRVAAEHEAGESEHRIAQPKASHHGAEQLQRLARRVGRMDAEQRCRYVCGVEPSGGRCELFVFLVFEAGSECHRKRWTRRPYLVRFCRGMAQPYERVVIFDRCGRLDRLRMKAAFGGTGEQAIGDQCEQRTGRHHRRHGHVCVWYLSTTNAFDVHPPAPITRTLDVQRCRLVRPLSEDLLSFSFARSLLFLPGIMLHV